MDRASGILSSASPAAEAPATRAPSLARTVSAALATDSARTLLGAIATALAYALAARLGAALRFPGAPVSALWLPTAILLAALLLAPRRTWWLYVLVVLPAHLLVQPFLVTVPAAHAGIGYIVNTGTAVTGAWLLGALVPGLRVDRIRTAVRFIVLTAAVVLGTSLLAAGAAVALHVSVTFWLTVVARTLSNIFSILTVVPLMLYGASWLHRSPRVIEPRRAAEAGVLALTLVTVAILAFVAPRTLTVYSAALFYAPFTILLWAVVRFGVAGSSSCMLLLAVLATWGALNQTGPFVAHSPVENVISLLLFLILTSVSLLLLAAALEERRSLQHASAAIEAGRRGTELLCAAVLDSVHEQIAVLDQAGAIIEANESWRRFIAHAAALPIKGGEVGDHYLQACAAAAQAGDPVGTELAACIREVLGGVSARRQLEFSREGPQGTHWYEMSVQRLRRPEGGAVVARADITARQRAINQAREQRQQLAHLGRVAVLGELSGAFAHELAQPLTSILGNAEAALQLLPDTAALAEIREMLRDIVREDVRAAEVIQRLRSMLARGETRCQPVELNQVVRDVLTLARTDLVTRSVAVFTQLEARGTTVLADPVQLQQVLLNLVVNACEAMAATLASERRLSIATRLINGGRAVECAVADRGCGVPGADIERIFQPFVTTKQHGLGLGLAICRSIVEGHGGRLWVENAADRGGAVFRFTANVAG